MHTVFRKQVLAARPYNWERGPREVRNSQQADAGLNCMALNHLTWGELFGVQLSPDLHLNEIGMDLLGPGRCFRPINAGNSALWRIGDIVLLGQDRPASTLERFSPQYNNDGFLTNWQSSPLRHGVQFTGEHDEATGEPLVLHIGPGTGTNVLPLSAVMTQETANDTHVKLHGVGRLAVAQTGFQGVAA